MTPDKPETFQERKKAMAALVQSIAKWPHCNHEEAKNVSKFNREVMKGLMNPTEHGAGPPAFINQRGPSFSSYSWQMGCREWYDSLFLTEDEAQDRLERIREKFRTGEGKPTATDGSKGQWASAMRSRITMLRWLLGELPNGIPVCTKCGTRQDLGGRVRDRKGNSYCRGCRKEDVETPADEIETEVIEPKEYFKEEIEA